MSMTDHETKILDIVRKLAPKKAAARRVVACRIQGVPAAEEDRETAHGWRDLQVAMLDAIAEMGAEPPVRRPAN